MITFVQTPQTVNTALTQHIPELYVSGVRIAPARSGIQASNEWHSHFSDVMTRKWWV